ncbi:MAG TPA: alpha/beta fold hydrolase [Acidiferrobacterales bacterium]|nr:alpha/beta fold hydrolase [Acidiferrobacterales bacterium]
MAPQKETVVLIHGLWFSGWSMAVLKRRLQRQGFDARIFSYKSVTRDLRQNAAGLQQYLALLPAARIHFVGHSLGGLVIRALFHFYPRQPPGRIVTLGTPHRGNQVAAKLSRYAWLRPIIGYGMQALLAGELEIWHPPPREIGVIAGNLSLGAGRLVVPHLSRPNDGTVKVAETHLPGAADHITLKVSHFGMLFSPQVARQTAHFLRSGRFDH